MRRMMNNVIVDNLTDDSKPTVLYPNVELVEKIVLQTHSAVIENKEYHFSYILYSLVRSLMYDDKIRPHVGDVTSAMFGYFIASYNEYSRTVNEDTRTIGTISNEAALLLFDLYVDHPHDSTLRRLVIIAADSIREVIIAMRNENTDKSVNEVLSYLSNITLITSTIKEYTKANRVKSNIPYIKWVREFLHDEIRRGTSISSEKLSLVIPQLSNRKRIISV